VSLVSEVDPQEGPPRAWRCLAGPGLLLTLLGPCLGCLQCRGCLLGQHPLRSSAARAAARALERKASLSSSGSLSPGPPRGAGSGCGSGGGRGFLWGALRARALAGEWAPTRLRGPTCGDRGTSLRELLLGGARWCC